MDNVDKVIIEAPLFQPIPPSVSKIAERLGRRGGKKKSDRKKISGAQNVAKAREYKARLRLEKVENSY